MNTILVWLALFAFVETLPHRFLPQVPLTYDEGLWPNELPMDRWYFALPPIERATGVIALPRRDEVSPAYGTATVLYGIAFTTMAGEWIVVPRVFQLFNDLGEFFIPGLLGMATVTAMVSWFHFARLPGTIDEADMDTAS